MSRISKESNPITHDLVYSEEDDKPASKYHSEYAGVSALKESEDIPTFGSIRTEKRR